MCHIHFFEHSNMSSVANIYVTVNTLNRRGRKPVFLMLRFQTGKSTNLGIHIEDLNTEIRV